MKTLKQLIIGSLSLVSLSLPVKAQTGNVRYSTCFDNNVPKGCHVRQTQSRLYGNPGWHIIANWSDGDNTQIFIPSKSANDKTIYAQYNNNGWVSGNLAFCPSNGYPPYIMVSMSDGGGTGCIPDFLPSY